MLFKLVTVCEKKNGAQGSTLPRMCRGFATVFTRYGRHCWPAAPAFQVGMVDIADPAKDVQRFCDRLHQEFLPVRHMTSYFTPGWHAIGTPFYSKPLPFSAQCSFLDKLNGKVDGALDAVETYINPWFTKQGRVRRWPPSYLRTPPTTPTLTQEPSGAGNGATATLSDGIV